MISSAEMSDDFVSKFASLVRASDKFICQFNLLPNQTAATLTSTVNVLRPLMIAYWSKW